ncbi:MAG: DUF2177 family protein [bacterium]
MLEIIKTYLLSLVVLMGLDGIWLGFISRDFYHKYLGFIFTDKVTWWPILIFYPIYAIGVVAFVLIPSIEAKSILMALWRGALLGLVAYAAYDLTNNATIANWPVIITFADMAWGIVVTALTSAIVYAIMR